MSKNFFRLVAVALLILLLMLDGCNISLPANQAISTSTLSLLLPSKTSILETATVGLDKTMLAPCDQVPEPQLIKPKDNSNNVYLSGTFYLCWYTEDSFDMDSGALGHTDPFGNMDTTLTDIQLRVRGSTLDSSIGYFILGVNSAYGIIFGKTGVSACVLTNEGRLGYLKVESVNPLGTEGLEISFVTWNKK